MKVIPTAPELAREAIIIIGGAIIAALVLSKLPALRAWINANTRGTDAGCNCDR